jgi:septal ring factor EnvC (AmiA/AmiB activator)
MQVEVAMPQSVSVSYKFVDGAHFFTAADKEWCGLCAASTDLKAAWQDVAVQLNEIAQENLGLQTNFQPSETVEEFAQKMIDHLTAKIQKIDAAMAELEHEMEKLQDNGSSMQPKHLGFSPKKNIIWSPKELIAA